MKKLFAVILAMCAGALAAVQQNPAGGPTPDGRGFNIRVDPMRMLCIRDAMKIAGAEEAHGK